MNNARPDIICVMGPTAAGKTDLAIALSQRLPCDLISVDSALVYRGMDIGTAKPDAATLAAFPHRLIDIRDPAEPYSAAEFRHDALQAIEAIIAAGRIPLLVGGTMLYFKALIGGLGQMPKADPAIRAQIEADAARLGWAAIHQQLAAIDPQSAGRIHPNDPQRLQRALEVYRISGVNLSTWHARAAEVEFPYRVCQLAISPVARATLHERIALRFRQMLQQGFVEEVEALYRRGDLHRNLPAIRAVGYRQVWDYLDGRLSYDEMVERGIIATRQLAKRQFTWLRSWQDVHHIYTDTDSRTDPEQPYRSKTMAELAEQGLKIFETACI